MALEPKAALRKSIRATCRALSEATVDSASRAACARALPLVASAKAISVYLAMPKGELSTAPLLTSLFEAGDKRVFVPRVEGGTRFDMRMLHVADASQLESFPLSKWKIPEPTDEQAAAMEDGLTSAASVIDCVIVPAVAFDRRCMRLGQGKGFYDTFLEKLADVRKAKGLPPAVTIGLGLSEQLVEAGVPVDAHDVALDYVCLPDETLERSDR